MIRRPPRTTRTYTLVPYTTLFRSPARPAVLRRADDALVGGGASFVDCAGRQRDEPQRTPPLGTRARDQGTLGADRLVEPVEERGRIDQHRAILEHQRRDAAERAGLAHGIENTDNRAPVGPGVESAHTTPP